MESAPTTDARIPFKADARFVADGENMTERLSIFNKKLI